MTARDRCARYIADRLLSRRTGAWRTIRFYLDRWYLLARQKFPAETGTNR